MPTPKKSPPKPVDTPKPAFAPMEFTKTLFAAFFYDYRVMEVEAQMLNAISARLCEHDRRYLIDFVRKGAEHRNGFE